MRIETSLLKPLAIIVLAGTFIQCTSTKAQNSELELSDELETSDEFLGSLDDPEAPLSQEESPTEIEDYSVSENYESFDPTGLQIRFKFDSHELTPEGQAVLDKLVNGLQKDGLAKLYVRGHTDKQGPSHYNDALSERRADTITKYLTNKGIDESRLIPVSLGESEPIEDKNHVSAFRKNRRGDFQLVYEGGAFN